MLKKPSSCGFGCSPVLKKCERCGKEYWSRPDRLPTCRQCVSKAVDAMLKELKKFKKGG